MKSCLEKEFRYVSSGSTDLKATFERVRREQEEEAKAKAAKIAGTIKPKTKGKINV
jgi:hypothetical protein